MKAPTSRRLLVMLPLGLVIMTISVLMNLTSCTPGSGVTVQESDVVATFYDTTYNFGAVKYFVLPDTIVHLTGDPDEPDDPNISRANDDDILALVAANFESRGYVQVDTTGATDPDFWVLLAATTIENYYVYGGGYGGYCWYYWCGGWYYPPYWGTSYAYTTGTLLTTMLPDTSDITTDRPAAHWSGAINGVLDDTAASKKQRISNSINQMFEQSPYLETSK